LLSKYLYQEVRVNADIITAMIGHDVATNDLLYSTLKVKRETFPMEFPTLDTSIGTGADTSLWPVELQVKVR